MQPKFSLQTVLDVRHTKVEALEIELGKLLQTRQQNQDLLETLKTLQDTLFAQLRKQQQGEMDLFAVQHLQANLEDIRMGITQVWTAITELDVQIDVKRQELVAARQSEETLGILKTKEFERFQNEQNSIEARAQDDIYVAQAFRQRTGGGA